MKHTFTYEKSNVSSSHQILTQSVFSLIIIFFLSAFSIKSNAQNVLVGLTSNGGPEGKGTAFSITTSGANYSIIQPFADWGRTPLADLVKGSDGNFYGTTSAGGTYTYGSVYKMTPAGAITILKQFDYTNDGAYPNGELIDGNDGYFYGMTSAGGNNTYGTIFKINSTGSFTVLKHFNIVADGSNPRGHLVLAADGNFYGMTYGGGANGAGTIFKMTPAGVYTTIHSFNKTTEGGNSYSSLTLGKDGNLYGVNYGGGTYNYGTIFKCTTSGTFTVLHQVNGLVDGASCQSDLIQATDGNFYGTCYNGGPNGSGTIFKVTPTGTFTVLRSLVWTTDGSNPLGSLYQNSDGFLYGTTSGAGANQAGVFFKISTAGAYTVLHAFAPATEGSTPKTALVKGNDGNLYGTTSAGGINTYGTIYKITIAGVLTPLAQFHGGAIGNTPYESLIKGKDSAYYGTTSSGGAFGTGTIFKICGGATTVLHSFNKPTEGGAPKGSLIQATDGNFYGMTQEGGSKAYGTIFKITPAGTFTVLHNFDSPTEGNNVQGSLVQGTDGLLYGMTNSGGPNGTGTIFKISTTGTFTVLHAFVFATEGGNPEGNLIQATDGNFYGIASNGGKIFKMTSAGVVTVLRALLSSTDGSSPVGSLVQGTDGKLYGTASFGGSYGYGTIFNITTTGTFKTLKHINGTTDGKTPKGNLIQAADGNFYGMTSLGGTYGDGTLFRITPAGAYTVLKHFDMDVDGGNPYGSLIIAPINNLLANPISITTKEDVKTTITLSGSGGSPFTFAIVTNPKHGKLTGTGANRTFTPTANYSGKDSFTYSVNVGCISSAPAKVNITMTAVADTPVLASIGNKSVVKNTTLTFTASATDADKGQVITYSLIGAPAGASINASTGAFTWTPTTAGNYTFKVRATDNSALALYDEEQITVTVSATLTIADQQQMISKENLQATLYPNPVADKIYITLQSAEEKIVLRIIDMKGVFVSTNAYTLTGKTRIEADAVQLSRGIYIAEIETTHGKQSLKFIKK